MVFGQHVNSSNEALKYFSRKHFWQSYHLNYQKQEEKQPNMKETTILENKEVNAI